MKSRNEDIMAAGAFVRAVSRRLAAEGLGEDAHIPWRDWFKKYLRLAYAAPLDEQGKPRGRDRALLDGGRGVLLRADTPRDQMAFICLVTNLLQADRLRGGATPRDLSSPKLLRQALQDRQFEAALARVAEGIGTHAAKEQQPDYGQAVCYPPLPLDGGATQGLFSATLSGVSAYSYMGYSGFSRLAHWWLIPCRIQGRNTCLLEALGEGRHALVATLERLAPSASIVPALKARAHALIRAPRPIETPPDRQLLMPMASEGGEPDYLAVTPVPSARLYRALRALADEPENCSLFDEYAPVRDHPNNISDTHGRRGGALPTLSASLPGMRRPALAPIEMQLRTGAPLIRFYPGSLARLRHVPRHRRQQTHYREACELFVQESALAPLCLAREMIATCAKRARPLPLPEDAWEQAFVCGKLARAAIRAKARAWVADLQGRHWRRGGEHGTLALNARAQAILRRAFERALDEAVDQPRRTQRGPASVRPDLAP